MLIIENKEKKLRFIAKEPSSLPVFRYVGPRLHRGGTTALIGDAVHTVKPYFGLGVNSAFEDVQVLSFHDLHFER